jgi:Carboxypeptidase regulatory-like domain
VTATDGRASIGSVRDGAYLLAASAAGYSSQWQEVVVSGGRDTTVEVRLQPLPGNLTGIVRNSATGDAVVGASVVLGTWSTETDDQGRYALAGLPPGSYALRVTIEGHVPHEMSVTIRPGASETVDVPVTPMLGSVTVRVVDASTGNPIEGATVSYGASDGLPCADTKLLVPLKRSRTYGKIRPRVAELRPIDSWRQEELHFFVFRLSPLDGAVLPDPPVAVFAMHPATAEPASAVIVSPSPDGAEAEVVSLLQADNGHSADPPPMGDSTFEVAHA